MMVRSFLAVGAIVLAVSTSHALAQDLTAGEAVFRKCQPCHDVGEAAKNKLGPELNGIDGRKAGTAEATAIGTGNKNSATGGSERSWKEYQKDPQAKWPGPRIT